MQKLAGLITESDIRKKLSIKEINIELPPASLDDLYNAVKGEHAKDVIESGEFTRVAQFGSGEDSSPPVNVMDELEEELSYFETEEDKDSDDYDDLMRDLEAAKEIAAAVKSLGGKVSYTSEGEGDDEDLTFVYSVNEDGDLIGQAI